MWIPLSRVKHPAKHPFTHTFVIQYTPIPQTRKFPQSTAKYIHIYIYTYINIYIYIYTLQRRLTRAHIHMLCCINITYLILHKFRIGRDGSCILFAAEASFARANICRICRMCTFTQFTPSPSPTAFGRTIRPRTAHCNQSRRQRCTPAPPAGTMVDLRCAGHRNLNCMYMRSPQTLSAYVFRTQRLRGRNCNDLNVTTMQRVGSGKTNMLVRYLDPLLFAQVTAICIACICALCRPRPRMS
jgi:hypothetical protein